MSEVNLYKVPFRNTVKWHCHLGEMGAYANCHSCSLQKGDNAEEYITKIRAQYRQLLAEVGVRKTKKDYVRR